MLTKTKPKKGRKPAKQSPAVRPPTKPIVERPTTPVPVRTRAEINELVLANTGLIHYVLRRYLRIDDKSPHYEDMAQEGVMILMNCAKGYNPSFCRFSTYATSALRNSLHRIMSHRNRHGFGGLCQPPPVQSLSDQCGASDLPIWQTLASTDDLIGEVEQSDLYRLLDQAVNKLPERSQKIIRKRFLTGCPDTLDELGRELGLNKERVRQVQNDALRQLQSILNEHEFCEN